MTYLSKRNPQNILNICCISNLYQVLGNEHLLNFTQIPVECIVTQMIQMRTLKMSEDKSLALGHTTRKLQCRDVKACYFTVFSHGKGQCH